MKENTGIEINKQNHYWDYIQYISYTAVLQIGRPLVRFQMVSLEFFIDIILPIALWPWGRLSLEQK